MTRVFCEPVPRRVHTFRFVHLGRRSARSVGVFVLAMVALGPVGCDGHGPQVLPPEAGTDARVPAARAAAPAPQRYSFTVSSVDTTFDTEEHFIAGVEMQLSGEPFAEAMGRNLRGYGRTHSCQESVCSPSLYDDPWAARDGRPRSVIDLAGFSSAVESYEYSKQPMNDIAFESGAGTSLLFGPVLDPDGATGTRALSLARAWIVRMAAASNATNRFVQAPDAKNPLGWPGLWPTLQPFSRWDPAIRPEHVAGCSITSDDDPGDKGCADCGRLRVQLHLASLARPRAPGRANDRSRSFGLGGLERSALDAQLSAGHARREGAGRALRQPPAAVRRRNAR